MGRVAAGPRHVGVYFYVWYYKIHRELLDRFPDHEINPAGSLLTLLLGWIVIVPPLVSIAKNGGRIAGDEYRAGVRVTASGGVGLLLWFLGGLVMPYYQAKVNAVIDADRNRSGDKVAMGDLEHALHGARWSTGDDLLGPDEGELVLDVEVTNTGDSSEAMSSLILWSLVDEENRSADITGSTPPNVDLVL